MFVRKESNETSKFWLIYQFLCIGLELEIFGKILQDSF